MQANLKVYNYLDGIIGFCVLYNHFHNKSVQALNFRVTNIEGSVLLSCTDTLEVRSVLASDMLIKLCNGAKLRNLINM